MDVSQNKFTNQTWCGEMSMEGQILEDQSLFSSPCPSHTLQRQTPFCSIQVPISSSILLGDRVGNPREEEDEPEEELGAMKEMMYKIAAMQPVDIDPATICKPKRRNVRISDDPQSVAARHRRERISEKVRILQRLVPGGTKMDTASMLDEAIRYVKFLKRQIRLLQSNQHPPCTGDWPVTYNRPLDFTTYSSSLDTLAFAPCFALAGGNGHDQVIN